jgi:type I restriction enzyme R subunit
VPRPHQFFGVKAAQERIEARRRRHLAHPGQRQEHPDGADRQVAAGARPDARILVVTDRDELDKQIEGVMKNAGVIGEDSPSPRITSRREFVGEAGRRHAAPAVRADPQVRPTDLKGPPPPVQGRFYVFVDECHRTQGGDMNKQMKRWLENAIFIGFTGTPLLRRDKQMTRDVFGTYIHTYKFHQAVADKVVLDLKYEARDVPQRLTSKKAPSTTGSSRKPRAEQLPEGGAAQALGDDGRADERRRAQAAHHRRHHHDFGLKPRLNNDRGTAILVAASIYDACHYFRCSRTHPSASTAGSSRPTSRTTTRSRASRQTATSATSSTPTPSTSSEGRADHQGSTRTRPSAASSRSRRT